MQYKHIKYSYLIVDFCKIAIKLLSNALVLPDVFSLLYGVKDVIKVASWLFVSIERLITKLWLTKPFIYISFVLNPGFSDIIVYIIATLYYWRRVLNKLRYLSVHLTYPTWKAKYSIKEAEKRINIKLIVYLVA